MFKFRRFRALFIKESYQIIRDPSSILIAVVLPLILLFLMGYAISLDSKNIPVGIVVEKSSKYTLSLLDAFRMSKSFNVQVGNNRMVLQKNQLAHLWTFKQDIGLMLHFLALIFYYQVQLLLF